MSYESLSLQKIRELPFDEVDGVRQIGERLQKCADSLSQGDGEVRGRARLLADRALQNATGEMPWRDEETGDNFIKETLSGLDKNGQAAIGEIMKNIDCLDMLTQDSLVYSCLSAFKHALAQRR